MRPAALFAPLFAGCLVACAAGGADPQRPDAASREDSGSDTGVPRGAVDDAGEVDAADAGAPDGGASDGAAAADAAPTPAADGSADAGPTSLDLHDAIVFDNPTNLADWPVTTTITDVEFQYMGMDGVHVEFSKQDGPYSWPDVTPPGWTGSLEYTLGFAEYIEGQWYASAAIQFWRGLPASGGNVAEDPSSGVQCTTFGSGSTCQVAVNWYYDSRWGNLAGYQPATGEIIGVFVVAGNVRGVTDGSQSPVQERSNVVLLPMPDVTGATYTF